MMLLKTSAALLKKKGKSMGNSMMKYKMANQE